MSGTRAVATFAVTGCTAFMAALDNLVVATALPTIRSDLGASLEELEWTVNAYTLAFAVFLLTAAAVGDRYGRKPTFLAGLVLFTAASAGAALATATEVLVAARAAQGLGAAVLLPLGLTLVVDAVPAARRGMAIAGLSAMSGLGIALGPFVGGAVVQGGSWEWIFWLNVPIGLVLLPVAALVLVPGPPTTARLDGRAVVLVTAGLLGVAYGLVRTGSVGWVHPEVVGAVVVGLALLAAFGHRQYRSTAPLVPPHLLARRGFALAGVVALFAQGGMFGTVFLLTQFMQDVLGFAPFEAGLRTLPWTLAPVAVAPLAALLADRAGTRAAMAVSTALQAVALGWFALVVAPDVPYVALVPPMLVAGSGMGLFFALTARQALEWVAPAEHGIASGVNNALRQTGTVLGVAVLASVFAANGGYAGAVQFVAGLRAALWVGALAVAVAFVADLLVPRPVRPDPVVGSSMSV
ncbi:MFS transporter [Pseudonocardia sp. MH-G8]|uniref:MFS transporter n=1 Tax=Pseudonocardia sp. MH-G8 TaxID=1854588 RepID=UPI000B9FC016|nr:MFS transporter [Pseudonocardia sp. MH-G8]OZM79643.1 MFS transporter [Pseudonocardia sp. MH-G8]